MNLFEKLKEKKYKDIFNYLTNNPDLNLNIKDEFGNYFIEYVLNSDDIQLISYVLTREIYLDIIDNNGTTILYNLIKFNKLEILRKVLKNDSFKIGIHLLDKKDIKGRTSLHYSIIFNNEESLNILLDNEGDPYIPDNNGDNIFFYCIILKRTKILLNLFEKFKNFRTKNLEGETLLQSSINYDNKEITNYLIEKTDINLDNKTKEYGTTALHQAVVNNNLDLINKLIKYGVDITISDNLGNNVLHFSIMEKNSKFISLFLNLNKIDLNLTNLNGFIPFNFYLSELSNYDNEIMQKFIEGSNLNIQNFNGDTSLHLLDIKDQIYKYKKILESKLLNIFIQNYDGKSVYNSTKDKKELIKIVELSYFNNLKENLTLDWEKKCSFIRQNIKSKLSQNLKTKDDCLKKIKKVILDENRSIPKVKEIKFDANFGVILKDCFFSGFPIDTLFGLLWLNRENSKINLILDYPLTLNESIINFYKKIGMEINFKMDFINTMILWSYQKIYFPDYFDNVLKKALENKAEIIVIPIGIETSQGAHTNILFWNLKKKTLERFEPNGKNPPINFNYNPDLLDKLIYNKFILFEKSLTYLKPMDYLPEVGFQMIENLENETCSQIGDPNGFCTVWCIWYSYQKSLNLSLDSKELVDELINNIKLEGRSFKNLIRNFSKNVSKLRDEYLMKVKLDINQWILSNYSDEQLNSLEKLILKLIN